MKMIKLCAVAAIALIGCGDNKSNPDAHVPSDAAPDGTVSFPAAPTLGDQIDRLGRPAVNTVLNHGFDGTAAAQPAKVAYNEMTSKTDWLMNLPEFKANLGIVDVLDTFCGNGKCDKDETDGNCPADCEAEDGSGNGCGNQALYNDTAGGPPNSESYTVLAFVLAHDELFLDTTSSDCAAYLAVEARRLVPNTRCGGRAPYYDVIDYSYSMLAAGLAGFNPADLSPKIRDGADVHTDITETFPYLGPPHAAP